ncbi:hypothetical protein GQ457_08G024930 [Hibiscus cannabinus]
MRSLYSVFTVKKQGKPIWEVRTRYWKLREGETRVSVLLEGIPLGREMRCWPCGGHDTMHVVERAVTRPRRPRVSRGLDLSKMLSEP